MERGAVPSRWRAWGQRLLVSLVACMVLLAGGSQPRLLLAAAECPCDDGVHMTLFTARGDVDDRADECAAGHDDGCGDDCSGCFCCSGTVAVLPEMPLLVSPSWVVDRRAPLVLVSREAPAPLRVFRPPRRA